MEAGFVPLNGRPFYVRRWGDPSLPKLLLLHGFPEFGGAWGDLAHRLAANYHCIAPDQRGFGQSWAPPEVSDYTTSALVGDMATLVGNEALTVVGHDWGPQWPMVWPCSSRSWSKG
ncbi:alpha/beta fold hydrolase [Sulfitobacter aestuariivivens]|uniref:alpha/beta fold hydrolase n=1 Tax=Sulfitobacter aestuariivivens TaxID=2766981 RepID=UPI003615F69E